MIPQSRSVNPPAPTSSFIELLPQHNPKQLLTSFWAVTALFLAYVLFWVETQDTLLNISAAIIIGAALIPSYLWCAGLAKGIPVFPVFTLTFISAYALPLVGNHPVVATYSIEHQFIASLTITGFLLLGTWVWYGFVKSPPPSKPFYRALDDKSGNQFFLFAFSFGVLFNIANFAGWLNLDPGLYSIARSLSLSLPALSSFILAYRLGLGDLPRPQKILFLCLLFVFLLSSALSFYLNGVAATCISAIFAYIIGRKKVPIIMIAILWVILTFFHYGKGDMRAKYWLSGNRSLFPWDYPAVYVEWAGYSMNALQTQVAPQENKEEKVSFSERASLMQMLLLAQDKSPEVLPFLYGKTYEIVPGLLVPRILNSNRIRSQEGTHMLSVHYGLQTYKETMTTSISWGLVAESYANFGLFGCAGLAILLGTLYGKLTRWSINAPTLSIQTLFTVLMITFATQTEWTAGTFAAAFSQSSMLLIGIAIVFMQNRSCSTK
jgi:hypothetical protein